jgi:hypothetical protein
MSQMLQMRAIAEAVIPEAARLTEQEWAEAQAIIDHALAQRPHRIRRQVRLLLRSIDMLAWLRRGRRLHRMPLDARTRFLRSIENSPILLIRRGFWGVRTLVLMGYYARPEAAAAIGYRADPRGWEARQ